MCLERFATKFPAWLHALEAVEVSTGVELGALDLIADIGGDSLGAGNRKVHRSLLHPGFFCRIGGKGFISPAL